MSISMFAYESVISLVDRHSFARLLVHSFGMRATYQLEEET